MAKNDKLLDGIEEKIRILGEQLIRANQEKAGLNEEIQALKNKIADLESAVVAEKSREGSSDMDKDQLNNIQKELNLYIQEVDECIDMLKAF